MKFINLNFRTKRTEKGQSFIELILVFTILMVLLAGMVEFGNLLNQYINIVDGAREGARFASNDDPFGTETLDDGTVVPNYEPFFGKIYVVVQGEFDVNGVQKSKGAISPIVLSKANHDDIVATFFSVTTNQAGAKSLVRFVSGGDVNNPMTRYNEHRSVYSNAQVLSMVDGTAPSTGILLVEVFYNYHQILKLFNAFGNIGGGNSDRLLPDPILVHAYSIMPLSSAEPTPTP